MVTTKCLKQYSRCPEQDSNLAALKQKHAARTALGNLFRLAVQTDSICSMCTARTVKQLVTHPVPCVASLMEFHAPNTTRDTSC
jgi:hypothetical protein